MRQQDNRTKRIGVRMTKEELENYHSILQIEGFSASSRLRNFAELDVELLKKGKNAIKILNKEIENGK